jgi:hypothetical protein
MKIEIRPYENGQGLWIDGIWRYGNPTGRCDANVVAHIIALMCRQNGWPVEYEMVTVTPDRIETAPGSATPEQISLIDTLALGNLRMTHAQRNELIAALFNRPESWRWPDLTYHEAAFTIEHLTQMRQAEIAQEGIRLL